MILYSILHWQHAMLVLRCVAVQVLLAGVAVDDDKHDSDEDNGGHNDSDDELFFFLPLSPSLGSKT